VRAIPAGGNQKNTSGGTSVNDKREIRGWAMYDWANSAFSTTVVTALLGPYVLALAESSPVPLKFFGIPIEPAAIYTFAVGFSVLLQIPLLPLLGTIVDYTHLKKRILLTFAYIGAFATILLFFVRTDMTFLGTNGAIVLGSLLLTIANLCFGGAIVAYNSFLPDIASPDRRDAVSSQGFALGYLGGAILLLINLAMLTLMDDTALAVRLSLASAGVWWLVFTYLYPRSRLKQRQPARELPAGSNMVTHGFKEIGNTLKKLHQQYPQTLRFLISYWIYNDGIQTVIVVSAIFAAEELGIAEDMLLILILMIQIFAFFGALLFGRVAQRIGAKRAVMISLIIWSGIVIFAYAWLYEEWQLFILGFFVALVLGGSQALSRSLFSQMIPTEHEAEYFGFYEITERSSAIISTVAFGVAVQVTGSQRVAIVTLIVFFILGLLLLSRVKVRQAIVDAGNDPSGVVI
jgi:UMF1 family MFS transporter